MRDKPFFIDGIPMKPAAELIIDAAARHHIQRVGYHRKEGGVRGAFVFVDEQFQIGRFWELRCAAKAAKLLTIAALQLLHGGGNQFSLREFGRE